MVGNFFLPSKTGSEITGLKLNVIRVQYRITLWRQNAWGRMKSSQVTMLKRSVTVTDCNAWVNCSAKSICSFACAFLSLAMLMYSNYERNWANKYAITMMAFAFVCEALARLCATIRQGKWRHSLDGVVWLAQALLCSWAVQPRGCSRVHPSWLSPL